MPLYEYECQSCGSRIEVLQRLGDPPLANCDCGDEGTLKKLVSAPAFQFKGEGWYVTDYARKQGKADKAEAKSDGSGDGGDKSAGDKSAGGDKSSGKDAAATAGTKAERVAAKSSTPAAT